MINIKEFLEKYYQKEEPIIIWCSAGPDSMFLLYKILETKYKKNLVVCYFNHKTRPDTENEENFLEKLAKKENIAFETASCDFEKIKKLYPSKSFEELAREKRYQFFDAILWIYKTNKIILAHHLDDRIETFFFNLARGSKLTGLINMTEKSWAILRPLLNLEKKEILEYLDKNNLKYFIDNTNFDIEITRNYLRNKIIPKFYKINSNFKENIKNTLNQFEEIKYFLDEKVENFLENQHNKIKNTPKYSKIYDIFINVEWYKWWFFINNFNELKELLQKELIRYIFYISNNKSTIWLSKANIAEIIKFINWKNNKTKKEIKWLKMFKENQIILF